MTGRHAPYIFGRRGSFWIVALFAILSSLSGCSSAPSTDPDNPSQNIFADLLGSSRRPANAITSPPDLSASSASGAGQSASTLPQTAAAQSPPTYSPARSVLPPSQIGPQTISAVASQPADSGLAVPATQQSPVTNTDILRSVYQSLKEGNECETPADTCYNNQRAQN